MANILTDVNRATWKTQARIKLTGKDDSALLPDATLNAFVDQAERAVKAKFADQSVTWAAVLAAGGDGKENLIDATLSQLCGILVTPIRNMIAKSEKFADMAETKDIDWAKMENDYLAEVESFLGSITGYTAGVPLRASLVSPETAMWEDLTE